MGPAMAAVPAGVLCGRRMSAPYQTLERLPSVPTSRRDLAVLLVIILLSLVYLRRHAESPIGIRLDSWSEANVLVSARNAERNGWGAYRGVAQHQVDRPPFVNDSLFYYAHYPLGASYLGWASYHVAGENLAALRWLPALVSVGALVLWFLLVRRIAGPRTALLSTAVLASSYGFVAFADDIYHSYSPLCLVGMMLAFVTGGAASGRRRVLLLAAAWVLLFINSFLSWEWHLWSQIFLWGYWLWIDRPLAPRRLALFVLAPLLAFGIHQTVRQHAFGPSPRSEVVQDLLRRTVRLEETADTPLDVTMATLPSFVATRFARFFGVGIGGLWLLLVVAGVMSGGIAAAPFRIAPAYRWAVLLFVCGISWWCVMWQHTAVHPHVMGHALLFYALTLGLALDSAAGWAAHRAAPLWGRALAAGLVAVIAVPHLRTLNLDAELHSDHDFRHPYGWTGGWSDVALLGDMSRKLPKDVIVLTNNNRLPLMRYWFDLPVYPASAQRYPFTRGEPLPESRLRFELTTTHLLDLYPDAATRPHVVYLYVAADLNARYAADPILWKLVDGAWSQPPSFERFRQTLAGEPAAAHTLLAQGNGWLCFAADDLLDDLPPGFERGAPPDRATFGPPR